MSKPKWKSAPDWANYIAMDSDGEWYWYENEPKHYEVNWMAQGRVEFASNDQRWLKTLEARP